MQSLPNARTRMTRTDTVCGERKRGDPAEEGAARSRGGILPSVCLSHVGALSVA